MKRILYALALTAVLLTLSACSSLSPSPFGEIPVSGTVLMDTQFPVYAEDIGTIQLALHNGTESTLEFGSRWSMEVYKNGQWMHIPFRENTAFNDLLYMLSPGGTHIFTVHTASLDYTISAGTYRIIKQMGGDFGAAYSAEFTVGESRVGADSPYGYVPLESLPADYTTAYEDGVIFVNSLGQKDSTAVDAFFSHYKMGMNTQLRLANHAENGALIFEDLIAERKLGVWRIRYRRDETRAGGTIAEAIYSYLVTDGEEIYLSNRAEYDKDSPAQAIVELLKNFDWIGHDSVKAQLSGQNERPAEYDPPRPAYWSPDGMKLITLSGDPLEFGVSQLSEGGGERGHMTGITGVPGMTAIRSVVWTADSETALLVCGTDKKTLTGYVFYSISEDQVLSYTTSAHDYVIDENGEILIPE